MRPLLQSQRREAIRIPRVLLSERRRRLSNTVAERSPLRRRRRSGKGVGLVGFEDVEDLLAVLQQRLEAAALHMVG